ncbi:MAG: endonuclease [Bacteroidota bacterium]
MAESRRNRYQALIEKIFFDHYTPGREQFEFHRSEFAPAAIALAIALPKNLGDVIYSVRYRTPLPASIRDTEPAGKEWIIDGAGRAKYQFRLVAINRIVPNPELRAVKIPDATPEIIAAHALSDEQALLAKVRYNRLIDIFLGMACYSLQNHLRTTVKDIGQIEIDEIYVGVDAQGRQYIVPVQAKSGKDQLATVQTKQDLACCAEKFPDLICRPISAQFIEDDLIAVFELAMENQTIKIVQERHYHLVPSRFISSADLRGYRNPS